MKTKRLLLTAFTICLLVICMCFSASAEERTVVVSGNCGADGDNVTYVLYKDGELVISGEGKIEKEFFMGNDSIVELTIEEGITSIGSEAFYCCENLKSVIMADSVTTIDYCAFYYCSSLSSISLSKNLTHLESLFQGCTSLKNISIPNGVISLYKTFSSCYNLSTVILPETLTEIGYYAFGECYNLETINIPDTVKTIDDFAFAGCTKLTSIELPENLETIGSRAFIFCSSLKELTIPAKISSIKPNIVYNCFNLKSLTILNADCFFELDAELHLPSQVILSGYAGSTTETYARYGYHFLPLDGENAGIIQNHLFPAYWSTILEPTCSTTGLKIKTCRTCGMSESEVIPCTEHSFSEWSNLIEADCVKHGVETRECSECKKLELNSLSPKGHTYSEMFTTDIEATCITDGSKSRHCTICDAKTDITIIEATNEHRYIDVTVVPNGNVESYTVHVCAVCDYSYKDEPIVPDEPTEPDIPDEPDTPTEPEETKPCDCDCHKGGIKGFFFDFINFFEKLFGKNKVCKCGAKH